MDKYLSKCKNRKIYIAIHDIVTMDWGDIIFLLMLHDEGYEIILHSYDAFIKHSIKKHYDLYEFQNVRHKYLPHMIILYIGVNHKIRRCLRIVSDFTKNEILLTKSGILWDKLNNILCANNLKGTRIDDLLTILFQGYSDTPFERTWKPIDTNCELWCKYAKPNKQIKSARNI